MAKLTAESVIATMAAQEQVEEDLMQLPNVIGVGTGLRVRGGRMTDELCVQVLVDKKMPPETLAPSETVPKRVPGPLQDAATDVLQVTIEPQQDTGRYRPVPGGISIGPEASVSAGTLGGWACDSTDDTTVFLTNNHVISGLDTMPVLRRVVQPGRLDGGVLPADIIGRLKRDVIVNTVPNVAGAMPPLSVVDAAIGTIDVDLTHNIRQLNVPAIYEVQAPALRMNVQKRGRTTRLTTNGQITTINTTILITYRNRTRLGQIQNSFIITSTDGNLFSNAGDSGSLILNQARGQLQGTFPVVGLLYGGGTNQFGTPITIANDINAVLGALNLETICTCVARAIIRAVFGAREASGAVLRPELVRKEKQLRRLRDQIARAGRFGAAIDELITQEAAGVGRVLAEDEKAFAHLVRALRPFVEKPSNEELLRTALSRETVESLLKFSSRVTAGSRDLSGKLSLVKEVASAVEGKRLGDVLRSAELMLGKPRVVRRRGTSRSKRR
jgi:hypothetical protein